MAGNPSVRRDRGSLDGSQSLVGKDRLAKEQPKHDTRKHPEELWTHRAETEQNEVSDERSSPGRKRCVSGPSSSLLLLIKTQNILRETLLHSEHCRLSRMTSPTAPGVSGGRPIPRLCPTRAKERPRDSGWAGGQRSLRSTVLGV